MERKLLKLAAVLILFVFMIENCSSTLSKSDRGKKKKKEDEVMFLKLSVRKNAHAIYCQFSVENLKI